MNYQEFVEEVNEQLNEHFDKHITSKIHHALKNNGVTRIGVVISNEGTNISPTIYLEEFYTKYQEGLPIPDIVSQLVQCYEQIKFEESWDTEQIQNFSLAKSKIAFKLINRKANLSLLGSVPFVPFQDLAIVFYILVDASDVTSATILITNQIQKIWDVSIDELYRNAIINTPSLLPTDFQPMCAVISDLLNEPLAEEDCDSHMYVLSNGLKHFGAACILYKNVLEDIGNQLQEDYYVLPSSIHEVIILPMSQSPPKDTLDEMIVDINNTQVCPEDLLSDHAYLYCREKKSLL